MTQTLASGRPARTAHPRAVLTIVLVAYLMIIVDTSVVITGLPDIRADLGLTPSGASWVQNAYLLVFGGLLLLAARARDLLGRRRVLVAGLVLFSAASVAVGAAPSAELLVAARALQGAGAAVVAPSALALLTSSFAEGPERSRAVAAYGSVAGIGAALGLVLGGFLADAWSWRVAFVVNLPVGALLVVLALRYLDAGARRPGRLDLLGAVTSTAGMTALVHGVVRSADAGWSDPVTAASLASGVLLLLAFVRVERTAPQPIMPLHLFADRSRTGAYLARGCFIGAMMSFFLFLSQFLQDGQGRGALVAGLAFLPMTVVNFAVALAVPRLAQRVGNGLLLGVGLGLALTGLLLLTALRPDSSYLLPVALPCVLVGAGQGLAFAPLTAAGIAGVRADEAGAASGVVNAFHQMGGALGLGLVVAVVAAVAGPAADDAAQVVHRVDVAMTGASALMALALVLVMVLVVPPWTTGADRRTRHPQITDNR